MPVPTALSPFFLRRKKPSMDPEGCFFCFCCFSFLAATRFSPTCLLRLRRHTNHRHRASNRATTMPPTTPEGRPTLICCVYYVCLGEIMYPYPKTYDHDDDDDIAAYCPMSRDNCHNMNTQSRLLHHLLTDKRPFDCALTLQHVHPVHG
jgi:hypothetical protein